MIKQHEEQLQSIELNYESDIDVFAQEIFNDIVVPFCDKYNLSFISGEQSFVFSNSDGLIHAEWGKYGETNSEFSFDLLEVLKILEAPLLSSRSLWARMEDYN